MTIEQINELREQRRKALTFGPVYGPVLWREYQEALHNAALELLDLLEKALTEKGG